MDNARKVVTLEEFITPKYVMFLNIILTKELLKPKPEDKESGPKDTITPFSPTLYTPLLTPSE